MNRQGVIRKPNKVDANLDSGVGMQMRSSKHAENSPGRMNIL